MSVMLNGEDLRVLLRDLKEDIYTRIDDKFDVVNTGISGIHSRLDRLNGQTGKNTTDVAVLAAGQQALDKAVTGLAARSITTGPDAQTAIGRGFLGIIGGSGWKAVGTVLLILSGAFASLIRLVVELVHTLLPKVPPVQ